MTKKEFMVEADKTVAGVVSQAYGTTNMTSMSAKRGKHSFSYSVGNGYVNLMVEGLNGSIGVAWTGPLSVSPHGKDFYDYADGDNHEAVLCQLREFLWASMHKAEEHASKRRLSGFVWPAIRDAGEYIDAGVGEPAAESDEVVVDEVNEAEAVPKVRKRGLILGRKGAAGTCIDPPWDSTPPVAHDDSEPSGDDIIEAESLEDLAGFEDIDEEES